MPTDNLRLYHGSYCKVNSPDLEKCSLYKDFGRGFYLTTSKEQAINFAKLTTKKAIQNKLIEEPIIKGVVSTFNLHNPNELAIFEFTNTDKEWLHCVVAHRKRGLFTELIARYKDYDVIYGKIANDNTNATIVAYMSQTFGEVGSAQADNICISLLIPERLKDQFCFRTKKALAHLEFIKSESL